MSGPEWLDYAKTQIGTMEIPGPKHNPKIAAWASQVSKGLVKDDETAWCGTFVGHCLANYGLPLPSNPLSARSYLELPVKLEHPAVGAIVVFWRGSPNGWQGHVGFIAGVDRFGHLMVLGGNQNDAVRISPYDLSRILGYRWPSKWPRPERFKLPIIEGDGILKPIKEH